MSERVNQIREALEHWTHKGLDGLVITSRPHGWNIAEAARDFADLLTRLEDGSAYEAATEALYAASIGSKSVPGIADKARRTVDAALGLQEDEE